MIPAGPQPLVFDTDRQAVFLFEKTEREAPHRGHVPGRMTGADAAPILLESYV